MICSRPSDETLEKLFQNARRGRCPAGWTATAKTKAVFGIATGMLAIHSGHFIHRDLEPKNIFCDANFQVKIANIRTRTFDDEGPNMSLENSVFHALEMWSLGKLDNEHGEYNHKVDQYSFALTVYSFFQEAKALESDPDRWVNNWAELHRKLESGDRWVRPADPPVPDRLWGIITRCWATLPTVDRTSPQSSQSWRTRRTGTSLEPIPRNLKAINPWSTSKRRSRQIPKARAHDGESERSAVSRMFKKHSFDTDH
jgi:serine/threonine protein kinase